MALALITAVKGSIAMKKCICFLFFFLYLIVLSIPVLANEIENKSSNNPGIFDGVLWNEHIHLGFSIGMPNGGLWTTEETKQKGSHEIAQTLANTINGLSGEFVYEFFPTGTSGLLENTEKARDWILTRLSFEPEGCWLLSEIDGHPSVFILKENVMDDADIGAYDVGMIIYPRNDRIYRCSIYTCNGLHLSMNDLEEVASHIQYDPSKAPMVATDAELTIKVPNNAASVNAGSTLRFSASFANAKTISQNNKNNSISWKIENVDTGEIPSFATITNGTLVVDKDLDHVINLKITAVSDTYYTSADYCITALPILKGIEVDPANIIFYSGITESQILHVTADPPGYPLSGILYALSTKGVIDITDNGDGIATISPIKNGKATLTVKANGKSRQIPIVCVDPVTAVEIVIKGKAMPGSTVYCSSVLTPSKPGIPTVEWDVDVDESIASIDYKGNLKISKNATVDSIIHISCTATGAPEPITAFYELTVIGK